MSVEKCRTAWATFFILKAKKIKSKIADQLRSCTSSSVPDFGRSANGRKFDDLVSVSADDVKKIVSSMPSKSSSVDVLPASLLKVCIDVFAPVIAHLANLSFQEGSFPDAFKTAQVLPLLKKPGLDRECFSNFRSISNLSISKYWSDSYSHDSDLS